MPLAVRLPKMITSFPRYSWAPEFRCDSTICKLQGKLYVQQRNTENYASSRNIGSSNAIFKFNPFGADMNMLIITCPVAIQKLWIFAKVNSFVFFFFFFYSVISNTSKYKRIFLVMIRFFFESRRMRISLLAMLSKLSMQFYFAFSFICKLMHRLYMKTRFRQFILSHI